MEYLPAICNEGKEANKQLYIVDTWTHSAASFGHPNMQICIPEYLCQNAISDSVWTKAEDWRREMERNMTSSKDWGDLPSISRPEEGNWGSNNGRENEEHLAMQPKS